ncbi:MAG: hypothetical protein M3Q07_26880, partial [Pseudobdellovibrionaceae bacterium]|nr:hypothetical protein [Pseudobdellovibrionaceae bacterium]
MAAPKDPKDKPITLDLDIQKAAEREQTNATNPKLQFRDLKATVIRPNKEKKPTTASPRPVKAPVHRSKHSSKTKSSASKTKPLFIMAGLVMTGFIGWQLKDSLFPATPQAPTVAAPTMKARAAKAVPTEALPEPPPPPGDQNQDPHAPIRQAGLSQLGVAVDDKGDTFFSVKVKPKPVCHPADVEAMRNVVGKTGTLLLSLEPMSDNGKAKAPITRTISLKEIVDGTKISLPVNLKQKGVYGIYICTDAANTRSCGGKQPADFNKILNFRELDVAANAVFYYQFAVLGLSYPTVFTGLAQNVDGARDQLDAKEWKPQLDKAATMMRGVKSLPPKTVVEGNVVTLELQVAMINPDGS